MTSTDLHARVLATVKRIEAVSAAASLLQHHAGNDADWFYPETLEEINAAREVFELPALHDGEGDDTDVADGIDDKLEDPEAVFLDDPLEIAVQGRFDMHRGTWDVTGVVVVVATGGPHIEIEYDGANLRANGYWGGERVEGMPLESARAEALLDDMMQQVTDASAERNR